MCLFRWLIGKSLDKYYDYTKFLNKMNKKNILIVGGTGFIGYHLAKKAIQKKLIVTSISTKPAKKIRYLRKVKYIICDISDKKKLTKVIKKKYDYVVNLGGYVDHTNKKKNT